MPAAFRLPVPGPGVENVRPDVWISLDPLGGGQSRGTGAYFSYARLKPEATLQQARDDVARVAAEIAALDPPSHPSYTAHLDDLRESILLTIKPTLLVLIGAAAVLLLITCTNVAGLLLSRSVARARETAIRVALGAGQRQLAGQYLMEGLLVSLIGAVAGVFFSAVLVRIVLALAAQYIPRAEEISLDWTVVLFAVACALVASGLASLAPLWQSLRTAPAEVLSAGVRATASRHSRRLSQALVVAEIALAFTLLAAGAVLVTHLINLNRIAPGFEANHLRVVRADGSGQERQTRRTHPVPAPLHFGARVHSGRDQRCAHELDPAGRLLLQHDALPGRPIPGPGSGRSESAFTSSARSTCRPCRSRCAAGERSTTGTSARIRSQS